MSFVRAAVLCTGISLLPSVGSAADRRGWQTYKNEEFGFSLRYPPSMAAYTGEKAAFPAYFHERGPDLKVVLPVPYDESHISEAAVAIDYEPGSCTPYGEPERNVQLLAGKRFQRFTGVDSAGGHTDRIEGFQIFDHQQCFTIMAAIHSHRWDEARTPKEVERSQELYRSAKARLLQVIRTLQFTNTPERDWQTYSNDILGLRLLHPPSMTVVAGTNPHHPWPSSDVRLVVPAESLAGTHITEAFVSLYGGPVEQCDYTTEGDIRTLGDRSFRHYRDGHGITGVRLDGEFFTKVYRGRCLVIAIVIFTWRFDTPDDIRAFPKHDERLQAVTADLQRVVETVRFTDPPVGTLP